MSRFRAVMVIPITTALATVALLVGAFGLIAGTKAIAFWIDTSSSSVPILIEIRRTFVLPIVLIWHHNWDTRVAILNGTFGLHSPEYSR